MNLKTLVSPIAIVAALSLGSAAYAQTTVGDQEVSDADLPLVEEHCAALASEAAPADEAPADDAAADDAAAVEEAPADDAAAEEAPAEDAAAAEEAPADDAAAAEEPAEGEAPAVDLEAITLEDCQAAGLVE